MSLEMSAEPKNIIREPYIPISMLKHLRNMALNTPPPQVEIVKPSPAPEPSPEPQLQLALGNPSQPDQPDQPNDPDKLTPAERMYRNHLKNVSKYQKNNPEKMKEKNKKYNDKLKQEVPDKYFDLLQKKRTYYLTTRKPKLEALKQLKPSING